MDAHNAALAAHAANIERLRAEGRPTVPTTLGIEKRFNPFLRAASADEFAHLRQAKDRF